jgi:hypothetical protein
MIGGRLAWIVVVPAATPVTATVAVVAFAAKVTLEGTVATPILLELRFTLNPPAGAGPDKFKVRVCEAFPLTVTFCGEKLTEPVTSAVWLADA